MKEGVGDTTPRVLELRESQLIGRHCFFLLPVCLDLWRRSGWSRRLLPLRNMFARPPSRIRMRETINWA
jgi:hypothetical protein